MGLGGSRDFPMSYEDACAKAGTEQLTRLNDTFNRLSSNNYYLPQVTFIRDVLGDNVPSKLAEALYHVFGGGTKGISFKETLCGLILLIYGTKEEKAKLVALLVSEDGVYIQKDTLVDFVKACDGVAPRVDLATLFTGEPTQHPECRVDEFIPWVQNNRSMASFTQWLLGDDNKAFALGGEEKDPPTFHQTLAELHSLDQQDVMSVEKTYWSLRGADKCNLKTFEQYASPPLPKELCASLFRLFDVNCDGHIDLEEMVRGVALCCRREDESRHAFCFKMFDEDKDGALNKEELTRALGFLKAIFDLDTTSPSGSTTSSSTKPVASSSLNIATSSSHADASPGHTPLAMDTPGTKTTLSPGGPSSSPPGDASFSPPGDTGSIPSVDINSSPPGDTGNTSPDPGYDADAILHFYKRPDGLTVTDYVQWAFSHSQAQGLLDLLVQICHIRFGIRPKDSAIEAMVIGGYLQRFKRRGLHLGDTVYLMNAQWFKDWCVYTGYQGTLVSGDAASSTHVPGSSHKAQKKSKGKKLKHGKAHNRAASPATPLAGHELDSLASPNSGEPSLSGSEVNLSAPKPGPIDNSTLCVPEAQDGQKKLPSLTFEGGCLKRASTLIDGRDFVLLPEELWKVFTSWYGTADTTYYGPPLPRKVAEDGQLELYPVLFKIYRHSNPPSQKSGGVWQSISTWLGFGGGAATPMAAPLPGSGDVPGAVAPPPPKRVPYYQAAFNKKTTIKEISERMQQLLHVRGDELRIHDLTDPDHPRLLDNENETVESLNYHDMQKLLVETCNRDNTWPEEMISLVNNMKAKGGKTEPQPQAQARDIVPGATGLGNLGNTCFMNSALQCVSNAQPLTKYFRDREHLLEINKENPLGMKGVMAKRYAELIDDLWNSNAKSVTPLKFRFTVARYAPQFNGFQQQDAQELLAFVLDGLHEDLNRVRDKPYMELKDSDGRDDVEVAKEGWDYHCMRNNSIIVDLFQGQLKSVVRCRECRYQSVRFDPFTFLSLPLSVESTVGLEVIVVRLDSSQPVRYGIKVELDSKYVVLKEKLSQLAGILLTRIHLVEVSAYTVKSTLVDTTKIRSVLGGWLYAYETPEPPPVQPTPRADSPDEQARKSKVAHLQFERKMTISQSKNLKQQARQARANRDGKLQSVDPVAEEKDGARMGTGLPESAEEVDTKMDGPVTMVPEKMDGPVTVVPEIRVQSEEGLSVPSSPDPKPIEVAVSSSNVGSSVSSPPIVEPPEDVATTGGTSAVEPPVDVATTGGTSAVEPPVDVATTGGTSAVEPPVDVATTGGTSAVEPPVDTAHSSPSIPATPPSQSLPISIQNSGFVFAIHRRTYAVQQYFASCNKIKKALFGIPLLVPCRVDTPHREVYETIWQRCKRLLIPDPPNAEGRATSGVYPFKLVRVHRDGLVCDNCPWYRFCNGCPINLDDECIGNNVSLLGIDWDTATLNLKYQQALERPTDDGSMASLKTLDVSTIDLATCFKSFVREDNLGDDELWHCKNCQKQQLATKSLEIWRLPPILIIHLKRFQFFNGHWIKSQQMVRFPMEGLNPMEYTLDSNNSATRNGSSVEVGRGGPGEEANAGASGGDAVAEVASGSKESIAMVTVHTEPSQGVCEATIESRAEGEGGLLCETKMKEGVLLGNMDQAEGNDSKLNVASNGSNVEGGVVAVTHDGLDKSSAQLVTQAVAAELQVANGIEPSQGGGAAAAAGASRPTEHSDDSRTNKVYDLFAISTHTGVLGGGHYTSFAKNPNGNWYHYNDSSCKETSAERVSQECPYMLFYEVRGLDYNSFRAKHQGKKEDIGNTEDDRAFEETAQRCVVS